MQSNNINVFTLSTPVDLDCIFARYVVQQPTYKNTDKLPKPKKISISKFQSLKDQESAVIRDILSVLLGLEGLYIRYDFDFKIEDPLQSLLGPDYLIQKDIEISFKEIMKRLWKNGKYYFALKHFIDFYDRITFGKVIQRLCGQFRSILKSYEIEICSLQKEFDLNINFSLAFLEQKLNSAMSKNSPTISMKLQHLYEISQLIVDENRRRKDTGNLMGMKFDNIMKTLKQNYSSSLLEDIPIDSRNSKFVKGGVVLNVIQFEIDRYKGNSESFNFLINLFNAVSVDYLGMLNKWLQRGLISDPFDEFLIIENKDNENSTLTSVHWSNKFSIRQEGLLKQFDSRELQMKLLLTGRYLNIIRECNVEDNNVEEYASDCDYDDQEDVDVGVADDDNSHDDYNDGENANNTFFTDVLPRIRSLQNSDLTICINKAYSRANSLVFALYFNQYKLDKFIEAMNNFFLLVDGSSFNSFLDAASHELKKSYNRTSLSSIAKKYFSNYFSETNEKIQKLVFDLITPTFSKHCLFDELFGIIRTRATNADDVFNTSNLDSLTKLLKTNLETNSGLSFKSVSKSKSDRIAISRLTLNINIPFPLNLIILDSQKFEYQMLFRYCSLIKFLEKSLEHSWREIGYQSFWTWNFKNRKLKKWIKKCRFVHMRMLDFVRLYSFYIEFDVLDSNWSKVDSLFKQNKGNTFELVFLKSSITQFLSTSISESLLSEMKLVKLIYQLFTLIIVFHDFVMSMRKTLILMDEELIEINRSKFTENIQYDLFKNDSRLKKLNDAIDNYNQTFNSKVKELCDLLGYYGEIDSPRMLQLHDKLTTAFQIIN